MREHRDARVEWGYARFGDRFLADLTDGVIAILMAVPAYFLVDRWVLGLETEFLDDVRYGSVDVVLWFWFLFNMTYLVGKSGQSWGRRIWGIKVTGRDGQPIGFIRALLRNLFAIYISAPFLYLGFLWILWDPHRQAWHDKVFRTFVVSRIER